MRVIFTKRGESSYYDTDWPATYVKVSASGRHAIRLDGQKRMRFVKDCNLRAVTMHDSADEGQT